MSIARPSTAQRPTVGDDGDGIDRSEDAEDGDEDEDGAPPPIEQLFATETMAELSARQGRTADAIAIYRHLLAAPPVPGSENDDRRLRWADRLSALEAAPPTARVRQASARKPMTMAGGAAAPAPAAALGAVPLPSQQGALRLPMVVRQPVRSGQIVYAANGDLIVMAPVNSGAQVIADGNIHIYAPLRGRAVAGVRGATDAQVFCLALEAEIVGVDVGYVPSAEIPATLWGKPTRAFLRDGICVLEPLLSPSRGGAQQPAANAPSTGWRWRRKSA